MQLFVTYCSAEKAPDEVPLPALARYRSRRIQAVHEAAEKAGADFRILSGKYGLLTAAQKIPHYDHLLTTDVVARHTALVGGQLDEIAPERVVLFSRPVAEDPQIEPYREVMQQACARNGIAFSVIELSDGSLDGEVLAD